MDKTKLVQYLQKLVVSYQNDASDYRLSLNDRVYAEAMQTAFQLILSKVENNEFQAEH